MALPAPLYYLMTPSIPAINDSGQILTPAKETGTGAVVALAISAISTAVIGTPPNSCGATANAVYGINNSGEVLGSTLGASCKVFWIWANGTFHMLQPPDPTHFMLAGINDLGHVFGIKCHNIPIQSGCESGPILELGPGGTPLAYQATANSIGTPNNAGQVTIPAGGAGERFDFLVEPHDLGWDSAGGPTGRAIVLFHESE